MFNAIEFLISERKRANDLAGNKYNDYFKAMIQLLQIRFTDKFTKGNVLAICKLNNCDMDDIIYFASSRLLTAGDTEIEKKVNAIIEYFYQCKDIVKKNIVK